MSSRQVFQQSILINADLLTVERCFTDLDLMHKWLNPVLSCSPIGKWDCKIGSRSRFIIKIPLLQPTLESVVIERELGLVVWEFNGFFQGVDRWECQPENNSTRLINTFQFTIPNNLVKFGFNLFAANWTKADMLAQLARLKQVAENL